MSPRVTYWSLKPSSTQSSSTSCSSMRRSLTFCRALSPNASATVWSTDSGVRGADDVTRSTRGEPGFGWSRRSWSSQGRATEDEISTKSPVASLSSSSTSGLSSISSPGGTPSPGE
eukprot:2335422-Prymnesium_polylepis.2